MSSRSAIESAHSESGYFDEAPQASLRSRDVTFRASSLWKPLVSLSPEVVARAVESHRNVGRSSLDNARRLRRDNSVYLSGISEVQQLHQVNSDEKMTTRIHVLHIQLRYQNDWRELVQAVRAALAAVSTWRLEELTIDVLDAPPRFLQEHSRLMFQDIRFDHLLSFKTDTIPHSAFADTLDHSANIVKLSLGACHSPLQECPLSLLRGRKLGNITGPVKCIRTITPGNPVREIVVAERIPFIYIARLQMLQTLARNTFSDITTLVIPFAATDMDVLGDITRAFPNIARLSLLEINTEHAHQIRRRPWNYGATWSRQLNNARFLSILAIKTHARTLSIFGDDLIANWFFSSRAESHPCLSTLIVWQDRHIPAEHTLDEENVMMQWNLGGDSSSWGKPTVYIPGNSSLFFC